MYNYGYVYQYLNELKTNFEVSGSESNSARVQYDSFPDPVIVDSDDIIFILFLFHF
jgi:hypothetical protein